MAYKYEQEDAKGITLEIIMKATKGKKKLFSGGTGEGERIYIYAKVLDENAEQKLW